MCSAVIRHVKVVECCMDRIIMKLLLLVNTNTVFPSILSSETSFTLDLKMLNFSVQYFLNFCSINVRKRGKLFKGGKENKRQETTQGSTLH